MRSSSVHWLFAHSLIGIVVMFKNIHDCLGCNEYEFAALKDFYFSLNGDDWYDNTNWDFVSNTSNVTAYQVCSSKYIPYGLECVLGHIVSISFVNNHLNGELPNTLHYLSYLQEFVIQNESLVSGTVPKSIFNITTLNVFSLEGTNNTGNISDFNFKNWNRLQALTIYDTDMFGQFVTQSFKYLSMLELFFLGQMKDVSFTFDHNLCLATNLDYLSVINLGVINGVFPLNCVVDNLTLLSTIKIGAQVGFDDLGWDSNSTSIGNYKNLTGNLTFENINLTNLQQLYIRDTGISGQFFESNQFYYPNLQSIILANNELSGTIDSNVCKSLFMHLFDFDSVMFNISNNNFSGKIPECLWESIVFNKYNLITIEYTSVLLIDLSHNQFNGSILDIDSSHYNNSNINDYEMWDKLTFYYVSLSNNLFSNYIHNWIFEIDYPNTMRSIYFDLSNNFFNGTLPSKLPFFITLFDVSNNQLSGNIDKLFNYNNYSIDNMTIIHNESIAEYKRTQVLNLDNNKFDGEIPNGIFDRCEIFSATNNRFDKLPQVLSYVNNVNDSYSKNNNPFNNNDNSLLYILNLSKNKIIAANIGKWLNSVANYTNVSHLFLHENEGITGNLNEFTTNHNVFEVLTLHSCNIQGSLNKNLRFNHGVQALTLHDNMLSCEIPDIFSSNDAQADVGSNSTVVLAIYQNFFTIVEDTNDKDIYNSTKSWITLDKFFHANNLYLSKYQITWQYVTGVCILFCFVCLIVHKLFIKCGIITYGSLNGINIVLDMANTNIDDKYGGNKCADDNRIHFLSTMVDINLLFLSNWIMTVLMIILSIMYYVLSNHFECGLMLSHFSLGYLYFNVDSNKDKLSAIIFIIIILCLFILFNIMVLFSLYKFKKHQIHAAGRLENAQIESQLQSQSQTNAGRKSGARETGWCSHLSRLFCCFMWLLLCICGFAFTVFYVVLEDVPNNNMFSNGNDYISEILKTLVTISLFINNTYLMPKLVDSIIDLYLNCKKKTKVQKQCDDESLSNIRCAVLFILRSLNTFVIPFMASILFLNQCGNYWSIFWNTCIQDKNSFNNSETWSDYGFNVDSLQMTFTYSVTTHDSICNSNVSDWSFSTIVSKLMNIKLNKCLTQYFDFWIPILIGKFLLVGINPIMLYLRAKYNCNRCANTTKKIKKNINCQCCKGKHRKANETSNGGMFTDAMRSPTSRRGLLANSPILKHIDYDDHDQQDDEVDEVSEFESQFSINAYDSKMKHGNVNIELDYGYILLSTKIEFFIIFGFASPFLFAILSIAMLSNYYFYYLSITKCHCNIKNFKFNQIAIYLLLFSVLIEQTFVTCFVKSLIKSNVILANYCWMITLTQCVCCILDVLFAYCLHKYKID